MIPLTLVTGFLGTGKTTLLKQIISQNREKRLVFVVNEFAKLDVDGKLLGPDADVVSIPGGSIFCHCLTATFIDHLEALIHKHESQAFDGVVIEASGMANPLVIRRMLAQTGLDKHFTISSIIAVTEPESLLKLLHTLPNIKDQIISADVVLLNKIDCVDASLIEAAHSAISSINPGAQLHHTVNCQVELDLFSNASVIPIAGEYAKCRDPHYTQMTLRISDKPTRKSLKKTLQSACDELYRAKGWVICAEGPTFVDVASGHVQVLPAAYMPDDQSAIVIIGSGQAQTSLEKKLQAIAC